MKNLYKFHWDCGRQGDVNGLFVATQEEVDNLIGTVEKDEIKKVDVDSDTVEKITRALGDTWCGYNPLHYIQEDDEEED